MNINEIIVDRHYWAKLIDTDEIIIVECEKYGLFSSIGTEWRYKLDDLKILKQIEDYIQERFTEEIFEKFQKEQ